MGGGAIVVSAHEPWTNSLSDFENLARCARQCFRAGLRDAERVANDIAEVLVEPVAEHEVEGHVWLQFRRVPDLEACSGLEPFDADGVPTTRVFLEPVLLERAVEGAGHVAAGNTGPHFAERRFHPRNL